jgi:hypothetical protein
VQEQVLSDGIISVGYTNSLAIRGDQILFGHCISGTNCFTNLYQYNGATWVFEQQLDADAAAFDGALIVARRDTWSEAPINNPPRPALFAYKHNGSSWVREPNTTLVPPSDLTYGRSFAAADGHAVFGVSIFNPNATLTAFAFQYADNNCNGNAIPDDCDIAAATSIDCDANFVPDECQPDCNVNLVADACDIISLFSADCNTNTVPDECDLGSGTSADANGNNVPDECDPVYGDLDGDHDVDLDDILCVVRGFGNALLCPNADIKPCGGGNGIIDLDDLLAVAAAFAGMPGC